MKKIVILQPQFIPWMGFFEQIVLSDTFVFYDDVQFPQGRSFTSRVQMKTEDGQIKWLTIPVKRDGIRNINETVIDMSQNWKEKHLNLIKYHYRKCKFFNELEMLLEMIYGIETDSISEFNVNAIQSISQYLQIKREFLRSSEIGICGKSTERLVQIVDRLQGTHYITGHGALNYLNYDLFEDKQIRVEIMKYNCNEYEQLSGDFTPYVSILDGIANEGKNIINYMNSKAVYWREYIHE